MEPNTVQREEETVVGLGGSFGEQPFNGISKLWDEFSKRSNEIAHQKPGFVLGVCMMKSHPDCPLQPGDSIVYMAAKPVTKVEDVPAGMIVQKIPASKYAVFTHKGPLSALPQTIQYIMGTWVPQNSELHKKGAPNLELYDHRFNPETLDGEIDIYIPIN